MICEVAGSVEDGCKVYISGILESPHFIRPNRLATHQSLQPPSSIPSFLRLYIQRLDTPTTLQPSVRVQLPHAVARRLIVSARPGP